MTHTQTVEKRASKASAKMTTKSMRKTKRDLVVRRLGELIKAPRRANNAQKLAARMMRDALIMDYDRLMASYGPSCKSLSARGQAAWLVSNNLSDWQREQIYNSAICLVAGISRDALLEIRRQRAKRIEMRPSVSMARAWRDDDYLTGVIRSQIKRADRAQNVNVVLGDPFGEGELYRQSWQEWEGKWPTTYVSVTMHGLNRIARINRLLAMEALRAGHPNRTPDQTGLIHLDGELAENYKGTRIYRVLVAGSASAKPCWTHVAYIAGDSILDARYRHGGLHQIRQRIDGTYEPVDVKRARELEQARDEIGDGQHRDVVVTVQDSLSAGNCREGTVAFRRQHDLGRESTVGQLVALAPGDDYVLDACAWAVRRERRAGRL